MVRSGAGNDALVTQESSTADPVAQVVAQATSNVATVTQQVLNEGSYAQAQVGNHNSADVMQDNGDGASSTVSQGWQIKQRCQHQQPIGPIKPSPTSASLANSHFSVSQQIADGAEAQVAQSGQLNKATVTSHHNYGYVRTLGKGDSIG